MLETGMGLWLSRVVRDFHGVDLFCFVVCMQGLCLLHIPMCLLHSQTLGWLQASNVFS